MLLKDIDFINSNVRVLTAVSGYPRTVLATAFKQYLTDMIYDRLCR